MWSGNAVDELIALVRDGKVSVKIGLQQQGHIETVERMLAEGATWDEIGAVIHWHGPTAKRWYEAFQKHLLVKERKED